MFSFVGKPKRKTYVKVYIYININKYNQGSRTHSSGQRFVARSCENGNVLLSVKFGENPYLYIKY